MKSNSVLTNSGDFTNALFVANKPSGVVCSKFLASLKRRFGVKKAGFSGTLDPFASGVLLIGFGDATKLFRFLDKTPKRYRATLWFGTSSPTLDYTGISEVFECEEFSQGALDAAVRELQGKLSFIPPKFSAKRIDGKRAYNLARKGVEFELKACEMEVFEAKILHYNHPFLTFELSLSEGGFVRSWAELLCQKLGASGALSALCRLSEGKFEFDGMKKLDPREFVNIAFNKYRYNLADFAVGKKIFAKDFEDESCGLWAIDLGGAVSVVEICEDGRARYVLNQVKI